MTGPLGRNSRNAVRYADWYPANRVSFDLREIEATLLAG